MHRVHQKVTIVFLSAFVLGSIGIASAIGQTAPRDNEKPPNASDPKEQKEITPTRHTGRPSPAQSIEQIKAELHNQTVSVEFKQTPLIEVVNYIRERVSFNIIVVDSVDTSRPVTITLKSLRLDRVMEIILHQKRLTATYAHGVVTIKPEGEVDNLVTRLYDIRDVQFQLTDMYGPELVLQDPEGATERSSGGYGGPGTASNGNMGSSFLKTNVADSERKQLIANPKKFKNLIKRLSADKKKWNRKNASIEIKNKRLLVHQTPEVQKEISRLINQLRKLK